MVVFVVKRYAVREAEKWRYAVRKAKIGRYAVRQGGGGVTLLNWTNISNSINSMEFENLQGRRPCVRTVASTML